MPTFDLEHAVREFYPRIHRAALVLTGNPWDADDLAQQTFLQALKSADRFAGESSSYTWLYAILLRVERNWARRRLVRLKWLARTCDNGTHHPPADHSSQVREWRESLWGEVARLSANHRQALVLRYSEGLSYEQIAGVLDCPIGTVKSRLHHALEALRRRLSRPSHQWLFGKVKTRNLSV